MKIFLSAYRISTDRHDLQALKDPETVQAVRRQLRKALSVWMRDDGGFPVDVIPAIYIQTAFKFPFSGKPVTGDQQTAYKDASDYPGDYRYYRMFQQIVDQVVPGLLVLFPVIELLSVTDTAITTDGITPVFMPCIRAYPSEKLKILRSFRSSWKRAGILCVPDIRETVLTDAGRVPSDADSLFQQLRSIAPDAVIWEHPEKWPDSYQEKIEAFNHFLRIQ